MLKRLFPLAALCLLGGLIPAAAQKVTAQTGEKAAAEQKTPSRASFVTGPYLQDVSATGFTVVWTSDIDALAWVELAPDDGTHFYNSPRPKYYDRSGFGVRPTGKVHKVRIDGLTPGTSWRYRPMMKGIKRYEGARGVEFTRKYTATDVYRGQPYSVRTFPLSCDSVRFAVANDIHEKTGELRSLFADASPRDFVYLNGDMTNHLSSHTKIPEFYLGALAEIFHGGTPLFFGRGNHEYRGRDAVRWIDYFSTPTGKPYYSWRVGDFFFLALDSGEDKQDGEIENAECLDTDRYLEDEAQWLRETVASSAFRDARVHIVFCHIPPEAKAWYGHARVNRLFVPVLNEAGIDLMICGHTHVYSLRPADGSLSDARFPVVVNAARERMEVCATRDAIRLETFRPDGTRTHAQTLKLH